MAWAVLTRWPSGKQSVEPKRGGGSETAKKIEAIIKPFKLDEVKEALQEIGPAGHHRDRGERLRPPEGPPSFYRGAEYVVDFLPKVKIEVVLADEMLDKAIEAIQKAAKTGASATARSSSRPSRKRSAFAPARPADAV